MLRLLNFCAIKATCCSENIISGLKKGISDYKCAMNLVLGRLKSKYEYHITTQHVTLFLFSITGKTFTIICDWNKSVLWLSSPQSWRTVNTASDNCHRKTEPDLKTTDVYPDLRNPPNPTRLLVIFLLQHVVMYKCNTILMVFFFYYI